MPAPASRVLFLGLDGGTARVFVPAFDRGWMPNLEALWRRSARGVLRSSAPMVTPVAWTSFLTGCTPPRHGIHEFYRVDPSTRSIHPNDASRIRVPTLWQALSAEGREIVSLNLPMTYPHPPDVRGLVVAGTDAPDPTWASAQCPEFGRELREFVPAYPHKILWKSRPKRHDDLLRLASRTRSAFASLAEAAHRADARTDWTALLVHFHDLDSLQHRLWPYLELDDTGITDPAWNEPVVSCLRALDEAIGRLVELASSRDAAVIALSDHGFGPCRALVDVNGLLARAGLQRRLTYGTRFRYRFHRLTDRLNRWRARRSSDGHSRRTPRSITGSVGCDWSRTLAFAPFGQLSGCIFLNRDLVTTAAQADRMGAEICELFENARHPETDERLFAEVYRVGDRYGLDPAQEGLPDVLALSADGFQAQAKWNPFSRRWIEPDPGLPATHYRDGILSIDSPEVCPGDTLSADLHDVAPTVLAMLGLPVPATMEGRVLTEAFDASLAPAALASPEHGRQLVVPTTSS